MLLKKKIKFVLGLCAQIALAAILVFWNIDSVSNIRFEEEYGGYIPSFWKVDKLDYFVWHSIWILIWFVLSWWIFRIYTKLQNENGTVNKLVKELYRHAIMTTGLVLIYTESSYFLNKAISLDCISEICFIAILLGLSVMFLLKITKIIESMSNDDMLFLKMHGFYRELIKEDSPEATKKGLMSFSYLMALLYSFFPVLFIRSNVSDKLYFIIAGVFVLMTIICSCVIIETQMGTTRRALRGFYISVFYVGLTFLSLNSSYLNSVLPINLDYNILSPLLLIVGSTWIALKNTNKKH